MPIQGSLKLCCFVDKVHIYISLDTNSNRSILTYLAVDKGALFALALCCKKKNYEYTFNISLPGDRQRGSSLCGKKNEEKKLVNL